MPDSVSKFVFKTIGTLCLFTLVGCGSYRQNIMFRPGEGQTGAPFTDEVVKAEKNYLIQINDQLDLQVYANNGERIIDPNFELRREMGANANVGAEKKPVYFVATDGTAKLPMVGTQKLQGLTIREAELFLQKEYNQYYKDCFVNLLFLNKRVTVLGAPGGQVIPLVNENTKVTEVLALARGVNNDGKAGNIRLIRGDQFYVIDFGTIDGLQKGNMIVQPGDIIYVEPVRRAFIEGIRDVAPLISLVVSLGTLVLLITNTLNSN